MHKQTKKKQTGRQKIPYPSLLSLNAGVQTWHYMGLVVSVIAVPCLGTSQEKVWVPGSVPSTRYSLPRRKNIARAFDESALPDQMKKP